MGKSESLRIKPYHRFRSVCAGPGKIRSETAGETRPFCVLSGLAVTFAGANHDQRYRKKPNVHLLRETERLALVAEQDGSIAHREFEFEQRLREHGSQIDVWSRELAETFQRTAALIFRGEYYGLRDLLGVERAAALLAATEITADYTSRCSIPGSKNAFNGDGSIKRIRAYNDDLTRRVRVKAAQRTRQRGAHLNNRRPRERRAVCRRPRGSRRSVGTRAGPRSDDDPGGDPEPGERALLDEARKPCR